MKRTIFTVILTLAAMGMSAQATYFDTYQKMVDKQDSLGLQKLIPEWETKEGVSGDTYAAWFNYYLLKATHATLQLTDKEPSGESFSFKDKNGKVVGYITGGDGYVGSSVDSALTKIEEGIQRFPDRLDLSFGKIHLLLSNLDYDAALKELHRVLNRSIINGNKWQWTNNEATPSEGQQFLRDCMQDYFSQLYDAQKNDAAMALTEDVLHHYPNSIYFLNDKVGLLAAANDFKQALEVGLKAHEIDPSDDIITINIAYSYQQLSDKKNAILYYQMLTNSKDEDIKASAKEALKTLKK
jgi:tetratricopeptide (TPR) repeat protein